MRPVTALLSGLLLLHLTLVGADLPCAKQGASDATRTSESDLATHQHGHHLPPQAPRPGHHDSAQGTPTLPACCQALASCGVSLVESSSTGLPDLMVLAAQARPAARDVPPSWSVAPDPPPPKA
jgi:hypothetical protein